MSQERLILMNKHRSKEQILCHNEKIVYKSFRKYLWYLLNYVDIFIINKWLNNQSFIFGKCWIPVKTLYVECLIYICIHEDLLMNRDYCTYTRLVKKKGLVVL
jgi:hypothetical protein